ncbi:MAG: CehA/McbA family metallohydrolase [Clostridia bacterium]|nr:CehA/McbA family metallohydrolase [Clostridia bacterium]
MIRQQAFNQTGNSMLKGGLHCHTTRSDGKGAPDEVIRMHVQNGYDFLALTDHRYYNYENFAPEQDIIIVPGMELDGNMPERGVHCFHTVCIGPAKENGNGFAQDQRFDSLKVTCQEEYQPLLDMAHENGNMTIYCHPEWSNTPAREFENLKGNFAMEIWNSGCVIECEQDDDAAYWDELLRQGKKIYGVATDDGHAMYQHCVGWVRVNAERNLDSILAALKDGAFYSSTGPEIYDFYVEDGKAVVKCSPADRVRFHYGFAPTRIKDGNGELLESAEFDVPEYYTYIRAVVIDEEGRKAWTNPIFLKD